MKFEDLLMQPKEQQLKRLHLENEVVKLKEELDKEEGLSKVLQSAIRGPVLSHPCISSLLPLHVQVLLAELSVVEQEISWLERKVEDLKLNLYQESCRNATELDLQQLCVQRKSQRRKHFPQRLRGDHTKLGSEYADEVGRLKMIRERNASLGSSSDVLSASSARSSESNNEKPKRALSQGQKQGRLSEDIKAVKPNILSEELIRCLIGIFLKINQSVEIRESSAMPPKLTLSCMNSKGFMAKAPFNNKPSASHYAAERASSDPYGVSTDIDGAIRDIGAYKNFIHITRNSIDTNRLSEYIPAIGELRILMHKLSKVDLTFLTCKQKLAFWINIYNACIMHAFLQHGLPSTQERSLSLMNKAVLNVGGIVLNALAIEHFILRHPYDSVNSHAVDEKEMLLRHAYGLGYPEPNVTFALCRGTWSSPALRVYTAEEVVNELGRARVEYLEASVGITSKRKIVVPALLQWHMRDFADDMESLLEWIYSQLPRYGTLKRLIMECLGGETKSPLSKLVEIQPYDSDFRYLFPL